MKINSTTFIVIVLAAFVALSGFLYGFLYNNILNKKFNLAKLNQEIVNEEQKIKHLSENKTLFDQVAVKREKLDSHFLGGKDEDTVTFLVALEGLASTSRVRLDISTPTLTPLPNKVRAMAQGDTSKDPVVLNKEVSGSQSNTTKWEVLRLQTKVEGNWSDIMQFIALVETMPYGVSFTQANLTVTANYDLKKKTKVWNGVFMLNVIKSK